VTLSLEDDYRVNARENPLQRVETFAEVSRTPSTTEKEGQHIEIAVTVNSHPEGFELCVVSDLTGRDSLNSAPQRKAQSQQRDLVSGQRGRAPIPWGRRRSIECGRSRGPPSDVLIFGSTISDTLD
jgi:hypothetical protein